MSRASLNQVLDVRKGVFIVGRFVLHAANAASPPMDISNHAVCLTRGMALRPSWSKLISSIASARSCPISLPLCICSASTCDATVRGTYSKPEAGARTACWCLPRGKLPCASSTCSTQEAGTRSPYVQSNSKQQCGKCHAAV
eukprot:scaffold90114_cov69-Phaeocystis_antarctica.AAC.3